MTTVAGGLPTPGLHEGLEDVDPFLLDALKKVEEDFKVDTAMLKKISQRFEEELHEGLAKTGANLSMNVTWVKGFPTGKEKGSYLTIDLGGTNMRVCWITLHGNGSDAEVVQDMFKLPPEIKKGEAHELWALVSEYLQKFIEKHDLKSTDGKRLPLGFTFSYPATQDRIDHGKLITWTKGFDIKGVEGQDVAGQLRDALEQRKLPVELVALINDTTGALIASAYNDPETIIGVIFGTGCNGAYMEDVGSIHKLKSSLPKDTPMAINCEYGAFDNSRQILPRTKYDIHIDNKSPRPGEQAFEKMSAGLYLGEIFRLVLEDMHSQSLMFKNQDVSLLHKEYHLDTGFLSALENHGEEEMMARFKEDLNIKPTKDELKISRCLAAIVALRGARLCACGVAAICHKKGLKSGHVAADGSVANKHPKFKLRWADALGEILDWPSDRTSDPITLTSAEDGSGVGAAVISAMAVADRG
ncbi:hexokinase-like protein [Truncatella angustata]|uniref:Phosphotransferase n=1 Tax=Truncatella angustata TaxID=152316 RepID=A0A9P8RQV1_9PEZI|nr:hexokinase-like protein [Truncatella angustata]KAH6647818.1 hexokinase-like protein [Truncatella angustata]